MAAKPPLSDEEVERILLTLAPLAADRSAVLVGGQAVAFWARLLGIIERKPELAPLLSLDIDFEGAAAAARRAALLLDGSARIPGSDHHTPNTGVVVFIDEAGVERKIDFLGAPLGLRAHDVRETAVRTLIADATGGGAVPLWVMHPERCMESCVYNVQILRRNDALSMRKLAASIACAHSWSRRLLADDSLDERDRVRAVLRLNERIFRKCLRDLQFLGIYRDHGVDPFDAVLADDERLPDAFRQRRFTQMRNQLEQRRKCGPRI